MTMFLCIEIRTGKLTLPTVQSIIVKQSDYSQPFSDWSIFCHAWNRLITIELTWETTRLKVNWWGMTFTALFRINNPRTKLYKGNRKEDGEWNSLIIKCARNDALSFKVQMKVGLAFFVMVERDIDMHSIFSHNLCFKQTLPFQSHLNSPPKEPLESR